MTTLSGSAGLGGSDLSDVLRVEDCVVADDRDVVTLVAHTAGSNVYSTFRKDGAAYQPPAGRRFIGLSAQMLQKGAPSTTSSIGFSTAATSTEYQSGAPTGYDKFYEIKELASNTIAQKQVLLEFSSAFPGYLTLNQNPGTSNEFVISLTGIEVDI